MKRNKLRIAVSAALVSALGVGTAAVAGSAANAAGATTTTPRPPAVQQQAPVTATDPSGPADKADATDPSGPGDKADATDSDNVQRSDQGGAPETNNTTSVK